jgi:Uma2 family endonuclease
MSPTAAPAQTPDFLAYASFRRFSLDEYHRMIREGILSSGEPFELLEGYMVRKTSHGTPHDAAMDTLEGFLLDLIPAEWFIRCQRAVTLNESEPEPDYAIVRGPRTRYRDAHPGPADVALVVEVADSSLRIDRTDKARIYARAGVAEYWVVNLVDRQVEVYAAPSGPTAAPAYATRTAYPVGTRVPFALGGVPLGSVAVAEVIR